MHQENEPRQAASIHQHQSALKGKVAVVTGSGRGIGRAIAIGLADAGVCVACGARSQRETADTVEIIRNAGGVAVGERLDVTSSASVEGFFGMAEHTFGGVDIVIVNAGIEEAEQSIEETDIDSWRRVIDVNLTGAFLTVRAAIPRLAKRGSGNVIVIGSGIGRRATAGRASYGCSKAGVWMLTRILAQELIDKNILVNELIPGPVRTHLLGDRAAVIDKGLIPATRAEWVKEPEDVVPLALFLASLPSNGPTGQTFALNRREI
jgi:3-oxoacyl-[acyl-carrier protein] reductase